VSDRKVLGAWALLQSRCMGIVRHLRCQCATFCRLSGESYVGYNAPLSVGSLALQKRRLPTPQRALEDVELWNLNNKGCSFFGLWWIGLATCGEKHMTCGCYGWIWLIEHDASPHSLCCTMYDGIDCFWGLLLELIGCALILAGSINLTTHNFTA
jgi:hypothetical protein